MNDLNNKNFILAIVLSMAIIFGWQYFYAGPIAEKAKQQATTYKQQQPRQHRRKYPALPSQPH